MQPRMGLAQGLWLNVDPRYENDYVRGIYEPTLQTLLTHHLHLGGVLYDVGAHIGFFSLLAARLVGEFGSVYAFEADPENVRRIEQHISRAGFTQTQVVPMAAWAHSGSLHFQRASEFSSRNRGSVVGTDGAVNTGEIIEVKAIALDEFSANHRPPTLIKIDVEGGEREVLLGAEHVLNGDRPVLICEVHNHGACDFIGPYLAKMRYSLEWFGREARFPCHVLAIPSEVMTTPTMP
jgi:FkbM family methyltransferase